MSRSYPIVNEHLYLRVGKNEFNLRVTGRYNFIVGNSGTGKTKLAEMVSLISRGVGYEYRGFRPIVRIIEIAHKVYFDKMSDPYVVVVDEFDASIIPREIMQYLWTVPQLCFLICARVLPGDCPFGIYNIFEMRVSGKFHYMEHKYVKLLSQRVELKTPDTVIICEDKRAGFEMTARVFTPKRYAVIHADGKSKLRQCILDNYSKYNTIIIAADVCGLGYEIGYLASLLCHKVLLLDNPSFEYQLLCCGLLEDMSCISSESLLLEVSEEAYYTKLVNTCSLKMYNRGYTKQFGHLCQDCLNLDRKAMWLLPQLWDKNTSDRAELNALRLED